MSKLDELKQLREQKKALNEQQKALQAELEATKEQRKEARTIMAQCRKDVREQKAALSKLTATIYSKFSEGDAEAVEALADELMEVSTSLVTTVRKFAEAAKEPDTTADEDL